MLFSLGASYCILHGYEIFVDAGVPASKFDEEATVGFFDDHDFTLETDVLTDEWFKNSVVLVKTLPNHALKVS